MKTINWIDYFYSVESIHWSTYGWCAHGPTSGGSVVGEYLSWWRVQSLEIHFSTGPFPPAEILPGESENF